MIPSKMCSTCRAFLPCVAFSRNRAKPDGFQGQCRDCFNRGRGRRIGFVEIACKACGRAFTTYDRRRKSCSRSCNNPALLVGAKSGPANPAWRGGQTRSKKGYWYVLLPDHPRAMPNGYVKRADLALEAVIGRHLRKGELAHHRNRDKEDDSVGNLELCTVSSHARIHAEEARAARGLLGKVEVPIAPRKCIKWPDQDELHRLAGAYSLRAIGRMLGCSQVAVFYRLRK